MAHPFRVIRNFLWFVVGVLLAFSVVFAHADTVPASVTWSATFQGSYVTNGASSASAACIATGNLVWPTGTYRYGSALTTSPYYCVDTNGVTDTRAAAYSVSSCPANSTVSSGSCSCNTGYSALNGQCVASCTAHSGQIFSSGFYDMGTSPTAMPQHSGCDGGCGTSFNGTFPVSRVLVGGVYHYFGQGSFVYDGSACTSGPSSTTSAGPSTPAPTCDSGQSMGQVNGQTVCLGSGGTPTDPNSSSVPSTTTTEPTVTHPDGSTTTTTITQNADGSTTTTTTVKAPDGTLTTSSNTVNSDGTKQDPMQGFCEKNPGSSMCKGQDPFCKSNPDSIVCKKSSFGGSCGAWSCDGDAVQCATAKKVHDEYCGLFVNTSAQSDLANAALSGADPKAGDIQANQNGETVDVVSKFNEAKGARWLASADLPPVSFSALGHSYEFDLTLFSQFLRVTGYLLVAVASVIAVRMVAASPA